MKYIALLFTIAGMFMLACENNSTDPEPEAQWTATNTGLDSKTVQCFASSANGDALYIGTLTGVYYSNDGGATWSARNNGLTSQDAKSLAVHQNNSSLIFLGTWGKGVFKSGDGGSSWQSVWDDGFDPRVYKVALGGNGFLWAATKNGLYKSADQGANWDLVYDEDNILTVAVNPDDPRQVIIGVQYDGNYKSNNNGVSWQPINEGIFGDPESESGVLAANWITFDPTDTRTMFLSTGSVDIFKSVNSGVSWQQYPQDKSDFKVLATVLDPANPDNIWAGTHDSGVWYSSNGGTSWQARNDGLDYLTVKTIAYSGGDSPKLFAGTAGGGIYIFE